MDFGTLPSALEKLSDVRGLPIVDAALVESDHGYEARIRAVVDLYAGSDALRWVLFWTDDWSATSEWFAWPLHR